MMAAFLVVTQNKSNIRQAGAAQHMKLTSSAFEHQQPIPKKYTCDGENINPPLDIASVPIEAQSLVLIVHDPDAIAPTPAGWTHWTVWNIDPKIEHIAEHSVPANAIEGITSSGVAGYGGPCPPSGMHHYEFHLYALDTKIELSSDATRDDLNYAMENHILEEALLVGTYQR